ncbi:hypothetical protein [uncultured Duncaniella sp.]|uniref:hypothetical protein n=1 Tax=uncultured Duncaniella sp. TaxID=2768039 RepID=UPI002675FADE|nr:hypothetical protein [uncultured Duncaniella sp.]MCI9173127.1 hypothetical protein [Muribaculaceae bacterium]
MDLEAILIPLGVCVALPVLIVWLVYRSRTNKDNRRAEVLIEAIKANGGIDADKLAEAFGEKRRTMKDRLATYLLRGCIFSLSGVAAGIALAWMGFAGSMSVDDMGFYIIATGVLLAVGAGYLITYYVIRKQEFTDDCSE